jgi:CubicO group peptidase (beta-lactamase class C family)
MRLLLVFTLPLLAAYGQGNSEQRVDAVFASYAKPGSPGCSVGVLQRGATVLAKGYGLADLEQRIPMTASTRVYMASVSKQFTALALLMAEKDGKLSLDDSIRKYMPELPAYASGVTIRRMLDHTAGLRDYLALWALRGFSNESVLREGATLALIGRQKALNFPPGTAFNYSNSGYLLAAVALQRATGKPLQIYAQEKIFQPLEMQSTRFQADHGEPIPTRAHGYQQRQGGWKTIDVGFDLIGSGGMYSNIPDMLRWARNFEAPVAGGDLLGRLQTPGQLLDGRRTPTGYALGMREEEGTYSHSGGASGYSTFFLRVPKQELTVICLCNIGGAPVARMAAEVAAIYGGSAPRAGETAAPKPRATSPWKPGEMERLTGSYWSEELFSVWQLTVRNGKLIAQTDGAELAVLSAGNGTYRAGEFSLRPAQEADGRVTALDVSAGRANGIVFVRR